MTTAPLTSNAPTTRKPWTMMVYLAADNNLANFGVDSLRQMKAAARDNINVIAELDVGPEKPTRRYAFTGNDPFGHLHEDIVETFGPTNLADPDNLVNFITWGARQFPADHYTVVIWGHGGGIDDDFPDAPDDSFIPRHTLLSLSGYKGIPDDHTHGILNDPTHSVLKMTSRGLTDDQSTKAIDGLLSSLGDALKIGDETLRRAAFEALDKGIRHALGKQVFDEIQKAGLNGFGKHPLGKRQMGHLEALQEALLEELKADALNILQNGALGFARQRLLAALSQGIVDSLQTGLMLQLQTSVFRAVSRKKVSEKNLRAEAARINDFVGKNILRSLENGIIEILRKGVLSPTQTERPRHVKSLAFVDHPMSFLTNIQLQTALATASERIGQNIDILVFDSCNMNMIEIGYGLRNSVNFLVASQDEIPDASLPYDRIIARLVSNPQINAKELASLIPGIFVDAYSDYSQKLKVALSVLDLKRSGGITQYFRNFVAGLRKGFADFDGRNAIEIARKRTRAFGENQFIDLLHFCDILTSAPDLNLASAASSLIAPLREMIPVNKFSANEDGCSGTAIYLPEFDSTQANHDKRLTRDYNELDLVKETGWGKFVADFLRLGRKNLWSIVRLLPQGHPSSNRKRKNRSHVSPDGCPFDEGSQKRNRHGF